MQFYIIKVQLNLIQTIWWLFSTFTDKFRLHLFRVKIIFRKIGCLVGFENSIFRKLFSVDRVKRGFDPEIVLRFYFTFKRFPENVTERRSERKKRERRENSDALDRQRTPIKLQIAPSSRSTPSNDRAPDHSDSSNDWLRVPNRSKPTCRRCRLRTHTRLTRRRRHVEPTPDPHAFAFWPDLMIYFLWVLYFCDCGLRNDVNICLGGEKMWENVFSSIFKNTTKHMKIFSTHNFRNATKHRKIFSFPENSISGK